MRKLFTPSLVFEGRSTTKTFGEVIEELCQEAGVAGKAFLLFWGKTHTNCAESLARLVREERQEYPWILPVAIHIYREILEQGYRVVLVSFPEDGQVRWVGRTMAFYGPEELRQVARLAHLGVRLRREKDRLLAQGASREEIEPVADLLLAVLQNGEEILATEVLARLQPKSGVEA